MPRTYMNEARKAQAELDAVRTNDGRLLRDLLDRADEAAPAERGGILRDVAEVATGLAESHQSA